jgi:hypothetical protein
MDSPPRTTRSRARRGQEASPSPTQDDAPAAAAAPASVKKRAPSSSKKAGSSSGSGSGKSSGGSGTAIALLLALVAVAAGVAYRQYTEGHTGAAAPAPHRSTLEERREPEPMTPEELAVFEQVGQAGRAWGGQAAELQWRSSGAAWWACWLLNAQPSWTLDSHARAWQRTERCSVLYALCCAAPHLPLQAAEEHYGMPPGTQLPGAYLDEEHATHAAPDVQAEPEAHYQEVGAGVQRQGLPCLHACGRPRSSAASSLAAWQQGLSPAPTAFDSPLALCLSISAIALRYHLHHLLPTACRSLRSGPGRRSRLPLSRRRQQTRSLRGLGVQSTQRRLPPLMPRYTSSTWTCRCGPKRQRRS